MKISRHDLAPRSFAESKCLIFSQTTDPATGPSEDRCTVGGGAWQSVTRVVSSVAGPRDRWRRKSLGYVLMVLGVAATLSAVFNWSFVMDSDRAGFLASAFGDLGWRIMLGVLGVILVLVGIDYTWHVF